MNLLARYRGALAVALLLLFPLVLLYAQTRDPGRRGPIVGVVVDVAGGIERMLLAASGTISDLLHRYVTSVASVDELIKLRRDSMAQALLQARITELETENIAVRKLADAATALGGPRPIGARIIGRSGEPLSSIARIDRGTAHGVKRGDGVISSVGVVGRVLTAGVYASDVLLLADRRSAIDVVVQRTRARGLARGLDAEDRYRVRIEDFDRLADVVVGDTIVTSGLDPHLPRGQFIGTVAVVEDREDGLYRRAEIVPAAPLATVEHVLVLIRRKPPPLPSVGGDPEAEVICPDPLRSATSAEIVKTSAATKPVSKKQATKKSVSEKSVTDGPVTDGPVTDGPVTKKKASTAKTTSIKNAPTVDRAQAPATNKPATNKPATNKPATKKPATKKPATNKPATNKPATNKPATNKPATNKPPQETKP